MRCSLTWIPRLLTFEKLETHLKEKGMLPDEYFLYDVDMRTKARELPDFNFALCVPNFGGSEGIYLDIDLIYCDEDGKQKSLRFATGKTLQEGADAFFWMSRIAAECSLMLNGRGRTYEKHNVELVLKPEDTVFRFLGKRLLCGRVCLWHTRLDTKLSLLVKAGIGGFHTAGKQLAGKACNGVISYCVGFLSEPLQEEP